MGNKLTCRCLKPNASPKVGRSVEWVNPHPESYVCEVTQAGQTYKNSDFVFCKCHPVVRLSDLQVPKGKEVAGIHCCPLHRWPLLTAGSSR